MHAPWAYSNGSWISGSDLQVAVEDVGFLLGVTVTERLRTFHGRVFRLTEHMRRLGRSLEIIGLDAARIVDEVEQTVPEFVQRNDGQITPDDDWSICAFVTPGVSGSDRPTVCVHGNPLPFHRWAILFETGLPVVVSDVRQVPTSCWPAELKCRSRMHYYLADREAAARQPGARAILLDENGYVAEASTANVLVYRADEGLISPPRKRILAGVSLGVIEELAHQLNEPFVMRPLTVEELRTADEALLTSTSICVLPIVQCDGRSIGDGRPGEINRRLLSEWSKLVGLDVAEQARRYANRSAI
jgi:branched-subunit amino acid aminotransferase/4-amino-4-deoxychorismate lyase